MARVARDEFRERGDDIDFLHRFLGDPTARGPQHSFRWALLTGAGGEGKTRLAIEFLSRAESRMFRAGFLSQAELKQLDPRRWLPRWASLLVVDYPAQVPAEVAKILDAFSARACESGDEFGFPVRLLLLEREAEGEWFKTIVPSNNRGDNIRNFCFHDDGPKLEHRLKPLARADLIAIMRGRLLRIELLDDDELYSALLRVDLIFLSMERPLRRGRCSPPRLVRRSTTRLLPATPLLTSSTLCSATKYLQQSSIASADNFGARANRLTEPMSDGGKNCMKIS